MSVALVSPSAGYVGHGHVVEASSTLSEDGGVIRCWLYDPLLAFFVTYGDGISGGPGVGSRLILGVNPVLPQEYRQGLPAGNAVTMRVTFVAANRITVLDTADFAAAFLHDPVSGLGSVAYWLDVHMLTLESEINGLYALLSRTFPAPS